MALRQSSFSRLVCRRTTMRHRSPSSDAIMASPMAVLPEEFSTTVSPARKAPSRSAFSIMNRAIRSLTLPIGFMNSILANVSPANPSTARRSLTIGVQPTASEIRS